ncbi:hypothetical protein QQP08_019162 [Theobroma cacao]|nr:hypothetical protein QQP08_019162 [Theobroma cacao]
MHTLKIRRSAEKVWLSCKEELKAQLKSGGSRAKLKRWSTRQELRAAEEAMRNKIVQGDSAQVSLMNGGRPPSCSC